MSPERRDSDAPPPDVTALLLAWGDGDKAAGEQLLPAIYDELHRQAARAMRREADEHTLQATALVHEAYLRLVDQRRVEWHNRAQFFGVAAQVMRRVLVDHARARLATKRGGAMQQITLGDVMRTAASQQDDARSTSSRCTTHSSVSPRSIRIRRGSWSCATSAASTSRRRPKHSASRPRR